MMAFLHIFLSLISLFIAPIKAQKDNNPNCSCYVTSPSPPSYFTYHRFSDFRGIQATASDNYLTPPALLTDQDRNVTKPTTSPFFDSDEFGNDWSIQTWNSTSSPVFMVNSQQNVYINRDNASSPTYLTLRTNRLSTFQAAAEIDSNLTNIYYASIRIYARVRGSSGAVAGLFTFADNENESDIEVLTRDPTSVFRASNQPDLDREGNEVAGASSVVKLPATPEGNGVQIDNSWTDWTTYRLDWINGRSEWFANNVSVSNKTYGVPKKGSQFIMNSWSNGGNWSGNMTVGGQSTMDVQWVDMVYNVSSGVGKRSNKADGGSGCKVVCRIDGVRTVGFPEVTSSSAWLPRVKGVWLGAWMVVLTIAVFSGI